MTIIIVLFFWIATSIWFAESRRCVNKPKIFMCILRIVNDVRHDIYTHLPCRSQVSSNTPKTNFHIYKNKKQKHFKFSRVKNSYRSQKRKKIDMNLAQNSRSVGLFLSLSLSLCIRLSLTNVYATFNRITSCICCSLYEYLRGKKILVINGEMNRHVVKLKTVFTKNTIHFYLAIRIYDFILNDP